MNKAVIGVDDGFSETKAAWLDIISGEIKTHKFPSRARTMDAEVSDVSGRVIDAVYETEAERYWVTPFVSDPITAYADYPYSSLDRVLVAHAIATAGFSDQEVSLCTGLPADVYYKDHSSRVKKVQSLSKVVRSVATGASVATIGHQEVTAQGLAVLLDWMFDADGGFTRIIEEPCAVVDIGGRTTDVVVLVPGRDAPIVDPQRTGSHNIGAITIEDQLRRKLMDMFDLDADNLPDLTKAIRTGVVRIAGKNVDVSGHVEEAKIRVGKEILRFVQQKIGRGSSYSPILFAGGGALLFRELTQEYPNAEIVPNPEYANARGMLKIAIIGSIT